MSRNAAPQRQSTGVKMNNFMNKEAQKYLNPGAMAESVVSFDIETDSVLTAVDIGKPNAVIDIAPAVCTMDFIGCIIDGKWTVIDLEQADMKDDKNLLFVYNEKQYRVETCNIVLQYSRGHPSMTALNAAFNDDEENDGATIDTELSAGLKNAGVDKYKIQHNDRGQLAGLMSGDSDPDDENTVTGGGEDNTLADKTANLKIGNLAPTIVGSDGSNAPVIDARNVMNGYNGYQECPDARVHQSQMQQQIQQQQQQQQYQQNQQLEQQQKHQQYLAAQKQQQYIHEQYARQQQLRQEQQQKFEEQRRQEQEILIEQKRQEAERLQKEYEQKLEEQRRQEQDKLRQRYEKELDEHRRQEYERQRQEQEMLQKKYEQELADQKKKEQERLRKIMIDQKQKQQQEKLRKKQEAEEEKKRIEELKLEKQRLELLRHEQERQELQRQELQRQEQKRLQEEQRRQMIEQQRQEQEYLQQQEQLRQQEAVRAQKEVERQQRELEQKLEKKRMEKERIEIETRERAEWLEHQHKLEMQKIVTQRAELQRKERERQIRLKQIDDERVAREKQDLLNQERQRQQILAEQQKQLIQKYQGVSPGPYITPSQQNIAEKAEKLKQVAAYFSQQKYNLTHGAVPSSPPRNMVGAPGTFPVIAIPKLYQSPFGPKQPAPAPVSAPAPVPGMQGSPNFQMLSGVHHSPGLSFFNSPGRTSIGSSPGQNFGNANTYAHFPNPFNNQQQFQQPAFQPAFQQSCHYRATQFNSFGQYNPQGFQATVGFCMTKEEEETKVVEPEIKDKPAMIEATPKADITPKEIPPQVEEKIEEEAVSTSRVQIDGEWFKVPSTAVTDVNDGYCEVNFNGDKVKVGQARVVGGHTEVEQIPNKYEVFANRKWNIVPSTNITPSKKQPGTYIVKLNERCIRVNPDCLRLINQKPFREARAGEGGTSSGTSIQPNDGEVSSAQLADKPGNPGPDRVNDGPVGGGGRGPERRQPPAGGDPKGPVKEQNEQSDVKPNRNRKERKRPKPAPKTRTDRQRYPLRQGAVPKPRSCYFGKGFLPEITGVQSKRTCSK